MTTRRRAYDLATITIIAISAAHARAGVEYELVSLLPGDPPGVTSDAYGIDDRYDVVGFSDLGGTRRAFLYRTGVLTPLDTPDGATSTPTDVNKRRRVVGQVSTPAGNAAAIWDRGLLQLLDGFGGVDALATAVNRRGDVVGWSTVPGEQTVRPFVVRGGLLADIGTFPDGTSAWAEDVNDAGVVVGWGNRIDGLDVVIHAARWQNGAVDDLGTLGGPYSRALAVNDHGDVAGFSLRSDSLTTVAFLRPANGAMIDLGTLGGNFSWADDVNGDGVVVGFSSRGTGSDHAFVWRDGVMSDLNDLIAPNSGWELLHARAINRRGEIVGVGIDRNHGGFGFVLRPCRLRRCS
jgi:probable HAF family extracellular repeat protein